MKILQLDDSNSKRMEVQSVLKRMGIRGSVWVQSVEEGVEALKQAIAEGAPFDAAITDMHYPVRAGGPAELKAGRILIQTLKEQQIDVPVIVFSTSRLQEEDAFATIWYDARANWEYDLETILKKIRSNKPC